MSKIRDKRILKAARERQQVTNKGNPIRLSADFSAENLQARREWHDIFKVLKGKNLHGRRRRRRTKHKISNKKETIKIRAEINEKETIKPVERINETKSWFFEKISKIDKPLARLTKKQREKAQINKIRNERGEITTDTSDIQKITREYYEKLYTNKLYNLKKNG